MQVSHRNISILALCFVFCPAISSNNIYSREIDRQTWCSSYSALTPHFGILSAADLALATDDYKLVPYDPIKGTGAAYWQCFPMREVSLNYDSWRDNDSMGRAEVVTTMCSFEIRTRFGRLWNDYLERRAHEVSYCHRLVNAWRTLTQGESYICLHGEAAGIDKRKVKETKKTIQKWVWKSFKTHKGCYSHFVSDCVEKPVAEK